MARRVEEVVISGFALMHAVQCSAPQLSKQLEQATWQQTERELTQDKHVSQLKVIYVAQTACPHVSLSTFIPMESMFTVWVIDIQPTASMFSVAGRRVVTFKLVFLASLTW